MRKYILQKVNIKDGRTGGSAGIIASPRRGTQYPVFGLFGLATIQPPPNFEMQGGRRKIF
jgi:hypothetical protein